MSSSTLITTLLKSAQVGAARTPRSTFNPVPLFSASEKHIHGSSRQQASACDSLKGGVNQVKQKAKDVAGEVSDKSKDAAEKVKHTAEDVLASTKEAAQKAKETVLNRADVSKEYVKEHADQVKKSMNTKE